MSVFITLYNLLLDLFFPQTCVGCGTDGILLCLACSGSIVLEPQLIQLAGLNQTIVTTDYQDKLIQKLIKQFKYYNLPQLAAPLAEVLIATLEQQSSLTPYVIVAVPLHSKRQRQRGYNQSFLLAQCIADHFGWPLITEIQRVRNTEHQAGLDRAKRLKNLDQAFHYTGGTLESKHLLIIDDVVTTGTTLQSIAGVLQIAHPASITALAVARNREDD